MSSPDEIKSVTLKYCVDLLTNREPREGFKEVMRMKENIHEQRMKEKVENDLGDLSQKPWQHLCCYKEK